METVRISNITYYDIVCSIWKHIAVHWFINHENAHKLATYVEHKGCLLLHGKERC